MSPYQKTLLKLAEEIGLNRVIAGFHFRSDIKAGETGGKMTYDFLTNIRPPGDHNTPLQPAFDYRSPVDEAQKEWR